MSFWVLALCVCAANAAVIGKFNPVPVGQQAYAFQPQAFAKAFVQTVKPAVEVVAPTAYVAPQAVVEVPVPVPAVRNYVNSDKDALAAVLRADTEVLPDGFNYYFETSNGIAAQSSGVTKKVGNDNVVAVQGSYKYVGEDGKDVVVNYVADENGYQPQSDILPVGPPTPDYILRALEYIAAHYRAVEKQ